MLSRISYFLKVKICRDFCFQVRKGGRRKVKVDGSGDAGPSRIQGPGSRIQGPGSRVEGPGSRIQGQDPGSGSRVPASRAQGPALMVQIRRGSRILDLDGNWTGIGKGRCAKRRDR